jgi:chromosomal replication initiation ATPase DnaA
LAPLADDIISHICRHYNVSFDELLVTKRGVFNTPRNIAVYLLRYIRGDNLNDIRNMFQINAYSTVSSIIQTVSKRAISDRKLRQQIEEINHNITNGQM